MFRRKKVRTNRALSVKSTMCDDGARQGGCTLIELLVVVMSITLLSGVVLKVIKSGGYTAKSRDAQRVARIKKTTAALEQYFADNQQYPDTGDTWIPLSNIPDLGPYLSDVPTDPVDTGTDPCTSPDEHGLFYRTVDNGMSYVVATVMEVPTSNDSSSCTDLLGWETSWCGESIPTEDFCYAETDPTSNALTSAPGLEDDGLGGEDPASDICPNLPGVQTVVPIGYEVDGSGDCVTSADDMCPNIDGIQTSVPSGYAVDGGGDCVIDMCPNISGIQSTVPSGYAVDGSGNCVVDMCPNISGIQSTVPEGYAVDGSGDCVVDVCPNLSGIQSSIPSGYEIDDDGNCVATVVDVCPNIAGVQTTVPAGYEIDDDGNCVVTVVDMCPNIAGVQATVPDGYVLDSDGDCVVDVCENLYGIQTTVPYGYELDDDGVTCVRIDVCPNLYGYQVTVPDGYVLEGGLCVEEVVDVCPNISGTQTEVPDGYELVDGNCVEESTTPSGTEVVLTVDGYVDNDKDGPWDYIDTFTIDSAWGATSVNVNIVAEEGHPWPPYNCTPGPDVDPVTGETLSYCDQNQTEETFSIYINDILCYTFPDHSPVDDTLFDINETCSGAHAGTNTFRITHVGEPAYDRDKSWLYRGSISFEGTVEVEY
jgi:type II secretory pathway pseudopilin PulG